MKKAGVSLLLCILYVCCGFAGTAVAEGAPASAACPTNYWYGGMVTHAEDGYSYFVQYTDDDSFSSQTINICRIADDPDARAEVVWTESVFPGEIPDSYDAFDGGFVGYAALTSYGGRVYYFRTVGKDERSLCWIAPETGEQGTVALPETEVERFDVTRVRQDGAYLLYSSGLGPVYAIDLETETAFFPLDAVNDGLPEGQMANFLAVGEGYVYYYLVDFSGGDLRLASGVYRVPLSGGEPEALASLTREFVYAHEDPEEDPGYACVFGGRLWIAEEESLLAVDLETGAEREFPVQVFDTGLAIGADGVYAFNEDGWLVRLPLDGGEGEVLTANDSGKAIRKGYPMPAGDWIFYVNPEDDYGLLRVRQGSAYFPFENVMGDNLDDPKTWHNGPSA